MNIAESGEGSAEQQIRRMPKVELHVHLEGSIRPATVLKLAKRHGIALPADTESGLQEWYRFRDFPHFVEVYVQVSKCIRTAEDIELIGREFLEGQKEQNVLHSEVTYTARTIEQNSGIPFEEQVKALRKVVDYGRQELGVSIGFVLDIVRGDRPELAVETAQRAVRSREFGVLALGLAGEERLGCAGYEPAFEIAHRDGLPVTVHAGETCGPESIHEALKVARPHRIGHGVRAGEDPLLLGDLVQNQVPLEVCPSSNVCLGVFENLEAHPLKRLLDAGANVSINSDDPPMFGTDLTSELIRCHQTFGLSVEDLAGLQKKALQCAFLDETSRSRLARSFIASLSLG